VLCLFAAAGCNGDDGGFFSTTTGGKVGSGCNPSKIGEACYKQLRVRCDPGTAKFTQIEVCPNGTTCKERPHPTHTTQREAVCDGTPIETLDGGDRGDVEVDAGAVDSGGDNNDKNDPVCKRWNADRADLVEGKWTGGDLKTCKPGALEASARAKTIKQINLYRFLAGQPPIKQDDNLNKQAQACAELMAANNDISHNPPKSWKCWNKAANVTAQDANLSTAPAVLSVDRYMVDEGAVNAAKMGHRRWLLSNLFGPIGIGSTNDTPDAKEQASCMPVGGKGTATKEWVAWPPSGKIPQAAFWPRKKLGHKSVDDTGWSIQSDTIDFTGATVTVKAGIKELPIKQRSLDPGSHSKFGLAWNPQGWRAEDGQSYEVSITGISKPITYFVQVLDCD